MTKTEKVTRRSVLASFLALAVCVSMLVGTSYAWFTDSVTSSGNIIKSGKLDVEMRWADGKGAADTNANWQDASAGAIFKYELWEPGYVAARHINIKNVGSLAFQYKIRIQANGELKKNAQGHTLADAIDVYYLDPAEPITNRNEVNNKMQLIGPLSAVLANMDTDESTTQGVLYAANATPAGGKNQETVTIALKMRETAGNEYQNMELGTDFSVQLLATQYTYEKDSFDELYDDGLTPAGEGMNIVEKDGVQYLYNDDGTITLYCVTSNYQGTSFTIPNFVDSIGDFAFAYNSNVETVTVPANVKELGRGFDSSAVKNVILSEGLEKISNRAFNKTRQLQSITIPSTVTEIEPYAFQLSGVEEFYIPANVVKIGKGALSSCPNLKKITIAGDSVQIGTYIARPSPVLEEVHILGENVTFETGSMTFTNKENGDASAIAIYVKNETVKERLIEASNSSLAYGLNIILPASVDVGGVTMPVSHAFAESLGTAWDDGQITSGERFTAKISSADDMAALSKMISVSPWVGGDGSNMVTLDITENLDFSGVDWNPLGGRASLTINGNGHKISNLNDCFMSYAGYTFINDLTLENVTASGEQMGAFVGVAEGLTLNNCVLAGNINVSYAAKSTEQWRGVGAFIGWQSENATFNNVSIADNAVVNVVTTGIENGHADTSLLSHSAYVGNGAIPTVTVGENATVTLTE